MATRLEMVIDRLDGQLISRRKELTDLRLISLSTSGSIAETMRRAGHVMAYSHWEGFSKYAFRQYLGYLVESGTSVGSLTVQLRTLNYWAAIKTIGSSLEFRSAIALVQDIEGASLNHFAVDSDELTKTGNMDSRKFRYLLNICALEYGFLYQARENFIDQVLCGRRHRIAHGVLEPVSASDLAEALDGADELCQELNDQIQEALIYDKYQGP